MKVDKSKWVTKPISSFFNLQMGKTPSRKLAEVWKDGEIPWVSIADMKNKKYISSTKEMLPIATIEQCNIPLVPENTVIMSFKLTIGKTCITRVPLTTNEAIMAFYPKGYIQVDNSFLSYALSAISWKGNRAVKGLTINKKVISDQKLTLPSFEIQQSIASELDAIQAMIDGYKAQLDDLNELAKSIFLDMFGDPVTNPKGWEKKNLSSICIKLSTGPFGTMLHKSDYCENGIPSVNPQDIKSNTINFESTAKVSLEKVNELSNYKLKQNDIILARRGDLSKCAVVSKNEDGWLCGTGSFFLKLKDLHPIIFYYQYKSDFIQNYLKEKSLGATMPNLNQKVLNNLPIYIPPLTLQQQFAAKIETIETQKEKYKAQLADAEQLMAERMQYYFS